MAITNEIDRSQACLLNRVHQYNQALLTKRSCLVCVFTHAVSTFWCMRFQFLNWNISIQNAMHWVFTLVTDLGLAVLALTTHAFSACVNKVSQLGFSLCVGVIEEDVFFNYIELPREPLVSAIQSDPHGIRPIFGSTWGQFHQHFMSRLLCQ